MNSTPLRLRLLADFALLMVAISWGVTFPLIKYILEHVPPFFYLSSRYVLAALVLLPFAIVSMRKLSRGLWSGSILVGLFLGGGYVFQTLGLKTAGATVSAFLTGVSVVLVPILGFFLGRRPTSREWFGVALATLGLALLTLRGAERPGIGEFLVLICAVLFAFQILFTDRVASRVNPLSLATIQMIVVAVMSLAFLPTEAPPQSIPTPVWISLAAMAVLASAAAFTIQSWAQRFTVPTHVGLIFAFEPVSAALFSRWWLGEELKVAQWLGAALILAGIITAEIKSSQKNVTQHKTHPS